MLFAIPLAGANFVASEIEGVGIRHEGRIVIRNDHRSVSAHQFHGDIARALITLESIRGLQYKPYGAVVFDSSAPLSAPLSPELAGIIREAAKTHGVDPRLITAVARRESGLNGRAVSKKGAEGLMQLMPQTARFLGVADSFDPRQNVLAGTRYLRMLLDTFRGDLDLALAAYNAGPGAVERHRGIPPYRETRSYVAAVRATYERSLGH